MKYFLLAVSFLFFAGCSNDSIVTTSSNLNTNAAKTVTTEPTTTTSSSGNLIQTQEVAYYGNTKGYLAYNPSLSSQRPAVILIHEWWGLNENMKELARNLADQGYVALAVDMYDGKLATVQADAQKYSGAVRANPEEAIKNLGSAVAYLKSMQNVNKDLLAAVGYCFGGTWSYELARQTKDLKASVVYYGRFDLNQPFDNKDTAVLGHFGESDTSIALSDVQQLTDRLTGLSPNNAVFTYSGAGHAFANKGAANYSEDSAAVAWMRTLAFLKQHLK